MTPEVMDKVVRAYTVHKQHPTTIARRLLLTRREVEALLITRGIIRSDPAPITPLRARKPTQPLLASKSLDDEIVRVRAAKVSRQQMAKLLGVGEATIDEAITRLIAEGRIAVAKGSGGGAPKLEREIEKRWGKRDPNLPPLKLEGNAAYDQATYWLAKWGVKVTWQRFAGEDVPEINGRLTHVGELVDRYFDERRKWAARSQCAAAIS